MSSRGVIDVGSLVASPPDLGPEVVEKSLKASCLGEWNMFLNKDYVHKGALRLVTSLGFVGRWLMIDDDDNGIHNM
jgi:hypothetical protein